MRRLLLSVVALAVGLQVCGAGAVEPANPKLIPEARAVLDYLASLEGKATLAGVSGGRNAEAIKEVSGKYPAVLALDLSGWNSPPWGDSYNGVVQNSIDGAKAWWEEGGLVAMQLHWIHPSNPEVMAEQGPAWVYCLSWWGQGQKHPEQWIKHTYNHEFVVTRDELPPLKR